MFRRERGERQREEKREREREREIIDRSTDVEKEIDITRTIL